MMLELAVLIAAYLVWSVGVNTAGTVIGINAGSGVVRIRSGVLIACVFTGLGALFMSKNIMLTVGEKIAKLDMTGVLVVLATAAVILTFTTYKKLPIFETYLFIGAIAGYSLGSGIVFDFETLKWILLSLLISPVSSLALGYLIYYGIRKLKLKKIKSAPAREDYENKFIAPAIVGSMVLFFALGGNSVGVALGVLSGSIGLNWLYIVGIAGVMLGILTWSYRIANTVGMKLTDLSPARGFAVQLATGLVLLIFLLLSIPVSTTQTLIGATIGVGLARGRIENSTVKNIAASWIFGLPAAVAIAAIAAYIL